MTNYDEPLKPEEIRSVKDEDLDFSDIPELDESFWQHAKLVEPDRTELVSLRIRRSVLDWFKRPGRGYQTRINRVLETYVRAQRDAERRFLAGLGAPVFPSGAASGASANSRVVPDLSDPPAQEGGPPPRLGPPRFGTPAASGASGNSLLVPDLSGPPRLAPPRFGPAAAETAHHPRTGCPVRTKES